MEYRVDNAELIVVLDGDVESRPGELRGELEKAVFQAEGCNAIRVDAGGLSHIDIQGLHLLAGLHQECRKRKMAFRLTGVAPENERFLNLLRIADFGLRNEKEVLNGQDSL